jgi:anti-sigma factor (TIGR02949 family)
MNVVSINERSCEHYRRHLDAYLDNELSVESRQVVLLHVCSCCDCAGILDSRSRMKQLLRHAVAREESPVKLREAVRSRFGTVQAGFRA